MQFSHKETLDYGQSLHILYYFYPQTYHFELKLGSKVPSPLSCSQYFRIRMCRYYSFKLFVVSIRCTTLSFYVPSPRIYFQAGRLHKLLKSMITNYTFLTITTQKRMMIHWAVCLISWNNPIKKNTRIIRYCYCMSIYYIIITLYFYYYLYGNKNRNVTIWFIILVFYCLYWERERRSM